jgi:hypothetical protein
MRLQSSQSETRAAVLLSVLAVGLIALPAPWGRALRLAVRDGLRPGLVASASARVELVRTWQRLRRPGGPDPRVAQLEADVRELETARRRAELANAELRQQLAEAEQLGTSPWPVTHAEPLVVPELVEASVLSPGSGPLWRTGPVIAAGGTLGLAGDELVLEADGRVLDQGSDAGLATGQPVFAGRCVVGRLAEVGRSVSVVRPVTDPDFRGLARLVRRSDDGTSFSFGAEGIIEGTGEDHLKLSHIPATEPVAVGDEVYTGEGDGTAGHPMYYGRVTKAALEPGGQHWDIRIEPAAARADLRSVVVYRQKVNPVRTASN